MAQCPALYSFSSGTVILSSYINSNFTNVRNTINANDATNYPATYATLASPTFTGTVTIPTGAYLNGTVNTTGLTLPATSFAAASSTPVANKMVDESIIKAWGIVYEGTIVGGYNINSVSDQGVGQYRVILKTSFSSSNYVVVATAYFNGAFGSKTYTQVTRNSSSQFDILLFDETGTARDNQVMFICMGAQ